MQPIKGARQTELIVMIALFSALITVMTAFIKIPTPLGYIHIGDAFIFAAAMLLGPYAAIPAMIGSGLADFITAYFMYIPVTILIKGLMGLLSGFVLARKKRPLPLKFTFFLETGLILPCVNSLWSPAISYLSCFSIISRPHSAPCRSISFKALRVLSSAWS